MIKIQILPDETYAVMSTDKPVVGQQYVLENATLGTLEQNSLFHSLIDCFYDWMLKSNIYLFEDNGIQYDFRCTNKHILKDMIKRDFGEGYDYYCYADDNFIVQFVKSTDEIPDSVIEAYQKNKKLIKPHLKSWTKYTTKQRTKLIDTAKTLMILCGVDSKKFREILEGLEAKNERTE